MLPREKDVSHATFKGFKVLKTKLNHLWSPLSRWRDAVNAVTSGSVWEGGTESHSFNRLEEIALGWAPETPVLGCKISRCLGRWTFSAVVRFYGTDLRNFTIVVSRVLWHV